MSTLDIACNDSIGKKSVLAFEGKQSRPRNLNAYQDLLKFDASLLEGNSLLDFGCGYTNLAEDIDKRKIHVSGIYMVDSNPGVLARNPKALIVDGRNLLHQLGSKSADMVLALFSTYQIQPKSDRHAVLTDLVKTARKYIHLGPVFASDYDVLKGLSDTGEADIVLCRPFGERRGYPYTEFRPRTDRDYTLYMSGTPKKDRIMRPATDTLRVVATPLGNELDARGMGCIILRKRHDLQ